MLKCEHILIKANRRVTKAVEVAFYTKKKILPHFVCVVL